MSAPALSTPLEQPWPLDEPIPQVCFKEDICRILRVSMRQLDVLLQDNKLPLVALAPIDRRPRFTGGSVRAIARGRWATNDEPARVGRHADERNGRAASAPRESDREIRGAEEARA